MKTEEELAARKKKRSQRSKEWRRSKQSYRNEERRRYYERNDATARPTALAYESWTQSDTDLVMSPSRPPDRELVRLLGRTLRAIHARRSKVKRLAKQEAT